MSDPENNKGTWLKVMTHGQGIDLYHNYNLNREFMIQKHIYQFRFEEQKEALKEVDLWLQENKLEFAKSMINEENILRFQGLFTLTDDAFKRYQLSSAEAATLKTHIKELKMNINQNRPPAS